MSDLTEHSASIAEIADMDIRGRPFLNEQGNCVTRGFVQFVETDSEGWLIRLRDVEWLNKYKFKWEPDEAETHYNGLHDHTSVYIYFCKANPRTDHRITLSWYGCVMHIGMKSETPWQDNDWPDLDTEILKKGPMHP